MYRVKETAERGGNGEEVNKLQEMKSERESVSGLRADRMTIRVAWQQEVLCGAGMGSTLCLFLWFWVG